MRAVSQAKVKEMEISMNCLIQLINLVAYSWRQISLNRFAIYLSLFFLLGEVALAGAELKHGKYTGWIQLEGESSKIAMTADFFQESSEDFTKFPKLKAIVKMNLGGYASHEYVTEIYKDLKYDFDNGVLTWDEFENDLMMTTTVQNAGGKATISGSIFVRSSAVNGNIFLKEVSDEPDDDEPSPKTAAKQDSEKFSSNLDGQYEGVCDQRPAVFQIQTVRALKSEKNNESEHLNRGLDRYYGITGRIGFKNDSLCGNIGEGAWCSKFHFSSGSYNLFLGKMSLLGGYSSEECLAAGNSWECTIRTSNKTVRCQFKREYTAAKAAVFYSRRFNLQPNENQTKELPAPSPPNNKDLSNALKGRFLGFIHNETNDTYLPLRLDVIPFSTSENPHNPNQLMISTTASIFLGSSFAGSFFIQRFEPRSFYLRPGFVLAGPNADSFFVVTDWRQSYIRGDWYSKAFGKVGTVQLLKDSQVVFDSKFNSVANFAGEYERTAQLSIPGTKEKSPIRQWLRFIFPTQPTDIKEHVIKFTGTYQSIVGNTPIREIDKGTFDPYTGKIGWMISSTFSSGAIKTDGKLQAFWPSLPLVGVMFRSYEEVLFDKVTLGPSDRPKKSETPDPGSTARSINLLGRNK